MKTSRPVHLLLALFAMIGLSGCFQVERVVHLKADGSGTIDEKMMMSAATVAQMKSMGAAFGGEGDEPGADGAKKKKPFSLLDEEKLKVQAAGMGEGVTFVSAKPLKTAAGEGYLATYAFTDINKVKLSQGPADVGGGSGPGGGMSVKSDDDEPLTFQFTKGKPAVLTMRPPQPKKDAKPKEQTAEEKQAEAMQEAMLPMMQQMMKDMRITIALDVAGTVTESNAEYREGNRVTLMDVDFNKILADPAKMKELMKSQDKGLAESKALLKSIPGIKFDGNETLTIKFQ